MTGTLAVLAVVGVWIMVLLMVFAHFRFLTLEHRLKDIDQQLSNLHHRALWSPARSNRSNDHDDE
jgi:hypothetical protein